MTYEEAMQFWFGRVNYEQKSPQVGDFKLDRMRHLLNLLGNPHQRLRIVHIAGSKGKGSTSAMLGSILQREGYTVGLFTSPMLFTSGSATRLRFASSKPRNATRSGCTLRGASPCPSW